VIRKISLTLLTLLFVQSAFSYVSLAQSTGCTGLAIWYFPDPIPPGWNCSLPGQGPYSMLCVVPNGNCPPVSFCPTCGSGAGNSVPSAGSPINLTNGNTYIQEMDLKVPGLGGGLALQRTWNSIWPSIENFATTGMFGLYWRSTYEERIFPGSGTSVNYMVYAKSDGGLWYFASNGTYWSLASPANTTAKLVNSGTVWTLTFQNGEQRTFNLTSGSLTSIIDRNGNTTQLAYDGLNRLTTVTDPVSRHLYFTYGSGSSLQVTSVTSDFGISLSYSYDTQNRLTQVTKPDLTTVSFGYNSQSLITSVTDQNGKTLESHTYDTLGRGKTSSRALGVDAVTVTYQ
jgi:YD repeat-containing protein